jgi:hypothetical protein
MNSYYLDDNIPVSKIVTEEQQINLLKNTIVVDGIIDRATKVVVLNKTMTEVFSIEEIGDASKYFVDVEQNTLHFHPSLAGQTIEYQYGSLGTELISANKIYTNLDSKGNVTELLSNIIESGNAAIDTIKTLGDASIIINSLKNDISEGKTEEILLENLINNAKTLLKNKVFIVLASQLVKNSTTGIYEYTLKHNLNIPDITFTIRDTNGNELLNGCRVIDNNTLLVKNDEQIDIKVIFNIG